MLLDPLGEEAGRVLGLDAGRHDDGAALPPVHRGGNLPPGSQLQPSHALYQAMIGMIDSVVSYV